MSQEHLARQQSILQMTEALAADSRSVMQTAVLFDAPLFRRQLFRTLFAEIEGVAWGYKYLAVAGHETDGAKLEPRDLALAREESYELNEKGESVVKSARLRFAPNLLFAFRLLAPVFKSGWSPPTSDHRWQALVASAKVRDRLMHPKSLSDLQITDAELVALAQGYDWFQACQTEIYDGPTMPNPGFTEQLVRSKLAR